MVGSHIKVFVVDLLNLKSNQYKAIRKIILHYFCIGLTLIFIVHPIMCSVLCQN